jgi:hypothetical protein
MENLRNFPYVIFHFSFAQSPCSRLLPPAPPLGQRDLSSYKNYDFDLGRSLFLG